jgi:hypothetical protein
MLLISLENVRASDKISDLEKKFLLLFQKIETDPISNSKNFKASSNYLTGFKLF